MSVSYVTNMSHNGEDGNSTISTKEEKDCGMTEMDQDIADMISFMENGEDYTTGIETDENNEIPFEEEQEEDEEIDENVENLITFIKTGRLPEYDESSDDDNDEFLNESCHEFIDENYGEYNGEYSEEYYEDIENLIEFLKEQDEIKKANSLNEIARRLGFLSLPSSSSSASLTSTSDTDAIATTTIGQGCELSDEEYEKYALRMQALELEGPYRGEIVPMTKEEDKRSSATATTPTTKEEVATLKKERDEEEEEEARKKEEVSKKNEEEGESPGKKYYIIGTPEFDEYMLAREAALQKEKSSSSIATTTSTETITKRDDVKKDDIASTETITKRDDVKKDNIASTEPIKGDVKKDDIKKEDVKKEEDSRKGTDQKDKVKLKPPRPVTMEILLKDKRDREAKWGPLGYDPSKIKPHIPEPEPEPEPEPFYVFPRNRPVIDDTMLDIFSRTDPVPVSISKLKRLKTDYHRRYIDIKRPDTYCSRLSDEELHNQIETVKNPEAVEMLKGERFRRDAEMSANILTLTTVFPSLSEGYTFHLSPSSRPFYPKSAALLDSSYPQCPTPSYLPPTPHPSSHSSSSSISIPKPFYPQRPTPRSTPPTPSSSSPSQNSSYPTPSSSSPSQSSSYPPHSSSSPSQNSSYPTPSSQSSFYPKRPAPRSVPPSQNSLCPTPRPTPRSIPPTPSSSSSSSSISTSQTSTPSWTPIRLYPPDFLTAKAKKTSSLSATSKTISSSSSTISSTSSSTISSSSSTISSSSSSSSTISSSSSTISSSSSTISSSSSTISSSSSAISSSSSMVSLSKPPPPSTPPGTVPYWERGLPPIPPDTSPRTRAVLEIPLVPFYPKAGIMKDGKIKYIGPKGPRGPMITSSSSSSPTVSSSSTSTLQSSILTSASISTFISSSMASSVPKPMPAFKPVPHTMTTSLTSVISPSSILVSTSMSVPTSSSSSSIVKPISIPSSLSTSTLSTSTSSISSLSILSTSSSSISSLSTSSSSIMKSVSIPSLSTSVSTSISVPTSTSSSVSISSSSTSSLTGSVISSVQTSTPIPTQTSVLVSVQTLPSPPIPTPIKVPVCISVKVPVQTPTIIQAAPPVPTPVKASVQTSISAPVQIFTPVTVSTPTTVPILISDKNNTQVTPKVESFKVEVPKSATIMMPSISSLLLSHPVTSPSVPQMLIPTPPIIPPPMILPSSLPHTLLFHPLPSLTQQKPRIIIGGLMPETKRQASSGTSGTSLDLPLVIPSTSIPSLSTTNVNLSLSIVLPSSTISSGITSEVIESKMPKLESSEKKAKRVQGRHISITYRMCNFSKEDVRTFLTKKLEGNKVIRMIIGLNYRYPDKTLWDVCVYIMFEKKQNIKDLTRFILKEIPAEIGTCFSVKEVSEFVSSIKDDMSDISGPSGLDKLEPDIFNIFVEVISSYSVKREIVRPLSPVKDVIKLLSLVKEIVKPPSPVKEIVKPPSPVKEIVKPPSPVKEIVKPSKLPEKETDPVPCICGKCTNTMSHYEPLEFKYTHACPRATLWASMKKSFEDKYLETLKVSCKGLCCRLSSEEFPSSSSTSVKCERRDNLDTIVKSLSSFEVEMNAEFRTIWYNRVLKMDSSERYRKVKTMIEKHGSGLRAYEINSIIRDDSIMNDMLTYHNNIVNEIESLTLTSEKVDCIQKYCSNFKKYQELKARIAERIAKFFEK